MNNFETWLEQVPVPARRLSAILQTEEVQPLRVVQQVGNYFRDCGYLSLNKFSYLIKMIVIEFNFWF